MPPTGSETGRKNFSLIGQFAVWVEQDGTGVGFDSSTGFTLANRAVCSPDVSWIKQEKWQAIPLEQREKFAPVCPDFVIELKLKSATDSLKTLQDKMQEYLENGVSLGWLINAQEKQIYIYQKDNQVFCVSNSVTIKGEPLLPGFVLDLSTIW